MASAMPVQIPGRTASRGLAVFILIMYIFVPYKTVNGPPVETCHKSCTCSPVDMHQDPAINVQCGEGNLTKVPNMTFDEPVTILNVSFNELKTLEKETFLHYKSVNYLHLQRCRLRSISEEAFLYLVKLTFVDLSDNLFTSVSPDLFIGNQDLNELILRGNKLVDFQWNAPLLNGPPHLSKLDLQSCKLKNLVSETFSLLFNLQYLDISNNELELLKLDTLSSHQHLNDVNLENNRWKCGDHFYHLLCLIKSKEVDPHNRTVQCRYKNGKKELWTPAKQSSLCRLNATPSANSSHKTDSTSWTLNTTVIGFRRNTTPSATYSLKTDSTSWTLNTTVIGFRRNTTPSATSSLKTDSTSWTLKTTVTESDTSDVSSKTTLSPTTQEASNTIVWKALIISPIVVIVTSLVIGVIFVYWRRSYERVTSEPLTDDDRRE